MVRPPHGAHDQADHQVPFSFCADVQHKELLQPPNLLDAALEQVPGALVQAELANASAQHRNMRPAEFDIFIDAPDPSVGNMAGATTPLSNHAAGFDYLLSQSPSQAQSTPHGVGLWGGFDVLPLHRPAIGDASRHGPANIPTAAHSHLLPDRHVHPLHAPQSELHAKTLMLGESAETSTKGRAGAVIHEDSTNQNQLLKDSRPDQLQLSSEPDALAGNCPPIKFGVFTNLVSGSKFAAPCKLSTAAQHKMRSFASEEAPSVLADDANINQPADLQGLGRQTGQPMGTFSGQLLGRQLQQPMGRPVDQSMGRCTEETTHGITGPAQPEGSCPQVKFGVFTNLKTGGSFAAPSKWSAERLKGIFQDEPSDLANLARDTPLPQPQQQQQPRESAELVAADLVNQARQESAGACPQVEFGVFTNLKTGGNFAAPSKLSAAAQQIARDSLHEDTVESQLPAQHDSSQHPRQQPAGLPEQTDADVSNPASTSPEGSCSQVQPGVFTNLKAGGSSAPPSQLSAAAQQRFSETSNEEATVPPDLDTSNAQPQSHLPAGVAPEHTTADISKASTTTADALCPQVEFGVFTNLRTGGSFAAPRTLSAAAQQRARDFHHEHATANENGGMENSTLQDASPAASPAAGSAEPQARHSGSKWRCPPTALSRLSKLARSSPGVTLPQRLSAQQVQHSTAVLAAAAVGVQAAKEHTELADSPDVAKQQSREEQCKQPQQHEACLAKRLPPEDMRHVQMRAADGVVDLQEPVLGLAAAAAAAASLAEPDAVGGIKSTQPDAKSAVHADALSTNFNSPQPSVPDQDAEIHEALLLATADNKAAPGIETIVQHSTAPPVSLFMSSHGVRIQLSAESQAHGQSILQGEDEDTGSAASAASASANSSESARAVVDKASPTASGFTYGQGKPFNLTARGQARAQEMFQGCDETADPSIQPQQRLTDDKNRHKTAQLQQPLPSTGFTIGMGKSVVLTAKGKAHAANLFLDDGTAAQTDTGVHATEEEEQATACKGNGPEGSHAQAPADAPVASGFTRGNGKVVQVSAKAQSNVRNLFQDENIPAPVGTATAKTLAAVHKPSVKLAAGKGMSTTPKTAPTGAKPVLKRGTTTVGCSAGGLLFKKPRMSRLHTPRALDITPNRGMRDMSPAPGGTAEEGKTAGTPRKALHSLKSTLSQDTIIQQLSMETLAACIPCQHSVNTVTVQQMRIACVHGGQEQRLGPEDFMNMLHEAGASQRLATEAWLSNCYHWTLWKLAAYEQTYPEQLQGKLLTKDVVLDQLKYRYEHEQGLGHRPMLKAVLEQDQPANRPMVLCVSAIAYKGDGKVLHHQPGDQQQRAQQQEAVQSAGKQAQVQLTDGWYGVKAVVDQDLTRLVKAGNLKLGDKLRVCGAELVANQQAEALESAKTSYLNLHSNGVHRVSPMARMGWQKSQRAYVPLHCVHPEGGTLPCTLLVVQRKYPVMMHEKLPSGVPITRSQQAYRTAQNQFEIQAANAGEIVSAQLHERETQRCRQIAASRSASSAGEQLYVGMMLSRDDQEGMASLSMAEQALLNRYMAARQAAMDGERAQAMASYMDQQGLWPCKGQPIMPLLVTAVAHKGRVLDWEAASKASAIVRWQQPNSHSISEGQLYTVTNLQPWNNRSGPGLTHALQLRTGKNTAWQPYKPSESALQHLAYCVHPRRQAQLAELQPEMLGSYVDMTCVLLWAGAIGKGIEFNQQQQWLFLADASVTASTASDPPWLLVVSFNFDGNRSCTPGPGQAVLLSFQDLELQRQDHENCVWVAEANDFTAVTIIARPVGKHASPAAKQLMDWLSVSDDTMQYLQGRARGLSHDDSECMFLANMPI
ncbi:hypothetical protein WJX77_001215 [Trebouxia sp. C0004]